MNNQLLDPTYLQRFLSQHLLPTLDRFGQHFLVDGEVLDNIVQACNLSPKKPVVEVGPGLGVLTKAVAPLTSKVYSIELDRRIIPILKELVRDTPNIEVIAGDILRNYPQIIFKENIPDHYDVIGNIPYNISAKLLRHVLSWEPRPDNITFLIDAEVAKRISAKPPEMSVLAVSVQVYAEPEIIGPEVQPHSFLPPPKVKSAILRLTTRKKPLVREGDLNSFFSLVKAGFSQKRKTLQNSLKALWRCSGEDAAIILKRSGIDPQRRAQTLSIEEWLTILQNQKTNSTKTI